MRFFERAERAPSEVVAAADLGRGDAVLAFVQSGDSWLLGTRFAFVVVGAADGAVTRTAYLPWERVQAADWVADDSTLTVTEVGEFGRPRASFVFTLENPALLLQLVRERVSASVVLQRGYLMAPKAGFKVIGRRSPTGGEISWMFEYDAGIDPQDEAVVMAAEAALASARADVGE
ncbi:MAG: hypothetical protein JWQ74_3034 [Marmoricola sp.]|nr:hypothetical protein [Marmoricola sp.]